MLDRDRVNDIVKTALKEDIGPIDVTTNSLIQKNINIKAGIAAKADGVVCGLQLCEAVFEYLDKDIKFKPQSADGDVVYEDKILCYIQGPARPILTGERTALNFLGRLSGIATEVRRFVKAAEPYAVKIMDTRKTTPGLRYLEKYAVRTAGGYSHRTGLWDQVLIKDNHIKVIRQVHLKEGTKLDIGRLLKEIRRKVQKNIRIEIETASIEEFKEALKGRPDIIMLDNVSPKEVRRAIEIRKRSGAIPFIEVSGNITAENIERYAKCRPDMISVGSITHSFKSLDVSMEIL